MELRQFAERVLFASSLAEKLSPPDSKLTDALPGVALTSAVMPGRPVDLRMRQGNSHTPLPNTSQLEDDTDRGILLHFFGNHELLAAELMALVLLKFPDAPAAFRKDIARTLQEEQEHTRLYIDRMQECGVHFGSQEVSGFFWKSVSTMDTPLDYVSRLSLTFEQANLDFSRHFADVFTAAGDEKTASILSQIYRDEISHVGYGLKWFRRWKEPNQSDWAAYRQQLEFPLSPSRAKGAGIYNREGRSKAGLEADYINQLEVYAQSKGRTPNVYYFNPQAELSVAKKGPVSRKGPFAALARDLSTLNLFLGRLDDIALLFKRPTVDFLKKVQDASIALPEIQELDRIDMADRKLGQLRPWGWSPDSHAFLEPYLAQTTLQSGVWRQGWTRWYSKAFSTELLPDFGRVCSSLEEARIAVDEIAGRWVLKSPFGLAGKGMRIGGETSLSQDDDDWIRGVLRKQGAVIIEPWLDKVLDFSVQYHVDAGGEMRLLGYTRLENDLKGKFQGCVVQKNLVAGEDEELVRFFYRKDRPVQDYYETELPELLGPYLREDEYHGPLGVDALFYRDGKGMLCHHPLVEINPRHTMGRVALELAKHAVKGHPVRFDIFARRHLKRHGEASFVELAQKLETNHPLELEHYQNSHRRIRSGCLILNDPAHAEAYLAVMQVGNQVTRL